MTPVRFQQLHFLVLAVVVCKGQGMRLKRVLVEQSTKGWRNLTSGCRYMVKIKGRLTPIVVLLLFLIWYGHIPCYCTQGGVLSPRHLCEATVHKDFNFKGWTVSYRSNTVLCFLIRIYTVKTNIFIIKIIIGRHTLVCALK